MYTPTSRGFIPLVAIVLLGLLVVAGGTIAAVSIHNKKANKEQFTTQPATSTPEQSAVATGTPRLAPVQARVQSSGTGTSQTALAASSTPVAQIVRPMDAQTAQDCQEAKFDLADVKRNGITEDVSGDEGDQIQQTQQRIDDAKKAVSLLQTVLNLCDALKKPSTNTPDGDAQFLARESAVRQQFDLYK